MIITLIYSIFVFSKLKAKNQRNSKMIVNVIVNLIGFILFVVGVVLLFSLIIGVIKNRPTIEVDANCVDGEKAIKLTSKDFNNARSSIKIVGGSANPLIYNKTEIEESLKNAYDRGVKISVAVPKIKYDENKRNVIEELAKQKKITLYISQESAILNHFKIIDNKLVHSEKAHTTEEKTRHYQRFRNSPPITDIFNKRFNEIVSNSPVYKEK